MRYRGTMVSVSNNDPADEGGDGGSSRAESSAAGETLRLPEWARTVLSAAPVAYVGMTDQEGPYVVPVSFAYTGQEILFHGGPGKKSHALERDARVCVAITSDVAFVRGATPCKDTFDYRSVLVYGVARRLRTPSEIEKALRLITGKYDLRGVEAAFDAAALERTWVYVVRIRDITFKGGPSSGTL
jgi:uncharacterized protein